MKPPYGNLSFMRRPIMVMMIPLLLASAALAQRRSARSGAQPPYKDIYLAEKSDRLVFGNAKLTLELGKQSGEWLSLTARGIDGALASHTEIPASVDFRIDDVWMIEKYGATYLRHRASGGPGLGTRPRCASRRARGRSRAHP